MDDLHPLDVSKFVAAYTSADETFIRFDWNGEHGDKFEDKNQVFRAAVLDRVDEDLQAAPIELVRDLFRAVTVFSREAWCIDRRVGRLGEHLLRHGADQFIEDYIEGKHQSFDASCGAAAFDCDESLSRHLLQVVRDRLRCESDPRRIEVLKLGEETFERWTKAADVDHRSPKPADGDRQSPKPGIIARIIRTIRGPR
jgi:hypothetical protein